jgi:type III pantothenate kinase
MILAIDCGNTRVKWGLRGLHDEPAAPGEPGRWRAQGARPIAEIARLHTDWTTIAPPTRIAIANVAGEEARAALEQSLARFACEPLWLTAGPSQCGVTNSYANPAQLGADRWAALIGARHLWPGASLVVNAGTATTVDVLAADGVFRGGLILPGVDLMKKALADHTAGLPLCAGAYADEPRNTADAIESGCLHAQVGAIERMHARLAPGAVCFLSGGAAHRIAPLLDVLVNIPLRVVDNLALEGLVRVVA